MGAGGILSKKRSWGAEGIFSKEAFIIASAADHTEIVIRPEIFSRNSLLKYVILMVI